MIRRRCEVCGEFATKMVHDVYVWNDYGMGGLRRAKSKGRHWFCDEHKRDPEEDEISVSADLFFHGAQHLETEKTEKKNQQDYFLYYELPDGEQAAIVFDDKDQAIHEITTVMHECRGMTLKDFVLVEGTQLVLRLEPVDYFISAKSI